jgi:PAS domain S-box-containing protein
MSTPTETIHVLHVDDDPNLADLVATFLERESDRIDVSTATRPDAGLDVLADRDVDCVVSDYDMPGTNGIEFLEAVRERHPDLPYILYTGKGSEEVASDAISAGVTDYLQKEGGTDQYAILANRIENAVAQRRAEREIERTREYFGTVLRHASDYVMIVDEEARIDYVSPAVERVLGYPPAELDGTDAFDLIHPDDLSAARAALETVIENPTDEHTVEFRVRHADGSWRLLEVRGRNLLDDPVVGGIIVNARDVTEKRSSRHELRTVVDNLPGYVYRHRYESGWPLEFVKGSAEDITGYTAAELEDDVALAEEIIHPEDREDVWTGVESGLADRDRFDLTYRIVTKDGETRWIRDQGQLIEDPTTGEELLDGFITDVTEHKRREGTLRRKERRYQAIFNDPNILVGLLDADGTVIDVNRTAMEYAAAERDAVVGEPFPATPWFDRAPDVRESIEAAVDRATDGEYVEFDADLVRPDGTPYTVDGVFRPVTDADGTVVSIIVSARDVTERRSQERQLRRYQHMVNAMHEATCIYDAEGRFEVVNDRLAEFYGTTPDALVGTESTLIAEIRSSADGDPVRALLEGDRSALHGELEATFPGHGEAVLEYRLTPLSVDGDVEGVVGVTRDITERTRREREFERMHDLLDRTERIADVGGWEIDTETMAVFWTEHLFELLGVDADDEPPLEEALDMYHEADRPVIEDALRGAIEDGESFDVDVRFRRPDGEIRWVRVQGVPTVEDGTVVTVRGAVQDITDRRERERELEQAREEYAELINGMNDTAWVLDGDGSFIAVNDAAVALLGYSRSELLTMRPHDIDVGLDDDEITALIDDMPADGTQVFETVHETADGEQIPVEISSSLVSYRGRRAILCIGRDISERKARERRLEEFASVVSHDLRNPLNVAAGRLELAREECDSDHLESIDRAHRRMSALIDDLLTLAREGTHLGDPEPIELAAFVRACWDGVETGAATLVTDLDRTIRADRSRLRQLLENLVRNAVEHGGSDVTVTVGELDDGFYVADDGPGIPEADRETVFEVGFSTNDSGTGFGLSIVRRIAEAHGWTVAVTESADGGARFEFTGVDEADR